MSKTKIKTSPASSRQTGVPAGDSGWRRFAASLGVDLRPGEGRPALLLFLCFFLFATFQYATKSVRQSAYITGLGAANLPWVYLAVALCSYPILRIYIGFADRIQRHRLMAASCSIIAASMVLFWWLFQFDWSWIPFALYVWMSIVYVLNVSQFWSFSNHVLDPRQAKRLFGFIGAGGLLGGIAGGQLAKFISSVSDTRTTFPVAGGVLLLTGALIYVTQRHRPADSASVAGTSGLAKLDEAKGGFELIKSSRQLRLIAAVMLLTVVVAQVVDIPFNYAVQEATTGLDNATEFFGNFYSIMGIAAFIFQLVFTSRIHRVLGVGVAMRILPTAMALGTAAVLGAYYLMPTLLLGTALGLKIGENGLRYSLDQSTRELLFLPVPSKARIKAKAFIDVFVQRGAKGLASLILLPVTPAIGLISPPVLAGWLAFPLIAMWLAVTFFAYREYVRTFRQGLKTRTVDAEIPINISDVATMSLLVHSLGSSDTRQVLQSLDILESNHRPNLVPPLLLYHDDAEVRFKTLKILAKAERVDAVPLIERSLADDDPEVRAEAIQVLAELHGEDACELMLPRLREADPGVRAAAVACVTNYGDEAMVAEATAALNDLLADEDATGRCEAAKALGAIHEPKFQERLIQLLYDREAEVAKDAIAAIQRRISRDGFNPLYIPTLVSLLQNRKLKYEARAALVAFGEPAIPALNHFMGDADEPVWVRRSLPKAVAKIGTLAAANSITGRLSTAQDEFQRRQLVESLAALPEDILHSIDPRVVDREIHQESRRYLQVLIDLNALGFLEKGRLDGPCVIWDSATFEPSMVESLLSERLEGQLKNLFGLMAVVHPARDIWAAYRSLTSGQPALRNHALEYLDNTLTGEMRKNVFAVIGDQTLDQKLQIAERQFGGSVETKMGTLSKMLDEEFESESDEVHLTLAALYTVHADRLADLYSGVEKLAKTAVDPFVSETADWVMSRLGLTPSG